MSQRIFTGIGDQGFTTTWGGRKVSKDDPVIELNGAIDFLLSGLDMARLVCDKPYIRELIDFAEKKLWQLGGEVSLIGIPAAEKRLADPITEMDLDLIEDKIMSLGEPPDKFIRFKRSGSVFLNECRVRSRYVERNMTRYLRSYEIRKETYMFINRLSDLLFMMAFRVENDE